MNLIELIAAIAGVICVVLTIRQNIWCWPVGLVQVVLYIFVFFQARLYSDVILHFIYVGLQFYGWYFWLYGGRDRTELPVTRLPWLQTLLWGLAIIVGTAIWGWAMATWTNAAAPYIDAFIAVASLVAQCLLARKKLESWYVWIVVDIIAIGLFFQRDLVITAGLYALFLGLATLGYFQWRSALTKDVRLPVMGEGEAV